MEATQVDINIDYLQGNWKQLKGRIREQWGKLTDDELDVIAGRKDQLVGKIQEKYGLTKQEAQRQFEEFLQREPSEPVQKY
jgi:uncharacterized protein YjbJ (UPF0337 family)